MRIEGRAQQWVRIGDEGSSVTFNFCPTCGSTVYYAVAGYDEESIAVPVGAFADPGFPAPTFSVYEEPVSARMGQDKVQDHLGAGADYIVSGDTSCLMHQKGCAERLALPLKFIHIAQVLNGTAA